MAAQNKENNMAHTPHKNKEPPVVDLEHEIEESFLPASAQTGSPKRQRLFKSQDHRTSTPPPPPFPDFSSVGLLTPPSSPNEKSTLSPSTLTTTTPARKGPHGTGGDFDTTVIRFSDAGGLLPPLTPPPSTSKVSFATPDSGSAVGKSLTTSSVRKTPFRSVGACRRYIRLVGVRRDLDQDSLMNILCGSFALRAIIKPLDPSDSSLIVAFHDARDSFVAFESYKRDSRLAEGQSHGAFRSSVSVHWASRDAAVVALQGHHADPLSLSDGLILVETLSTEPVDTAALQMAASAVGDVRSCTLLNDHRRIVLEMFDDRSVAGVIQELDEKTIGGQPIRAEPVHPEGQLYGIMTGSSPVNQSASASPAIEPIKQATPIRTTSTQSGAFNFDDVFLCSPFKRVAEAARLPGSSPASPPLNTPSRAPLSPSANRVVNRKPSNIYTPPHLRGGYKTNVEQTPPRWPASPTASASSPYKPIPSFGKVNGTPIKPEFAVSVDRLLNGTETRRTLMLKNLPNTFTRENIRIMLDAIVPREYDYVYCRHDFQNGANLGYAFVNFLSTEAIVLFVQAYEGRHYSLECSQKLVQLAFAAEQGKQAQIDKFRNSSVMLMDEYKPLLFHSEGPLRGLPMPFPAPNNAHRAMRSMEQLRKGLHTTKPLPSAARPALYAPANNNPFLVR